MFICIHTYVHTYVGVQRVYRKIHKLEETQIDTIFNKGTYV